MTLTIRPSHKPGYVVMPRALIFEYVQRAITWKRQQLAEQGHEYAHLLRAYEPIPECEVIDGSICPVVLGIVETGERWALRVNVASVRLQLRRLPD